MNVQTSEVEILWLAQNGYFENSRVIPHRHPDYFQIYHVVDGSGSFLLDDEVYPMSAGAFFLVHPDEKHGMEQFVPENGDQVKVVELKFLPHSSLLQEELMRISKPCFGPEDLTADFRRIFREAVSKHFYYEYRLNHLLAAWLYRFIDVCKNFSRSDDQLAAIPTGPAIRIREFIDAHYMEDISLERIAQSLQLSRNYLCRLFREGSGMTINDYLNGVRIDNAKRLLMEQRYSLEEISRLCGFNSINYFNNVFKKTVGVPPGVYRRSELVGGQFMEGKHPMTEATSVNTKTVFFYPIGRTDVKPR